MRLYVFLPLFALIATLSTLPARNASATIIFDDGSFHVVDAANSFPFDNVEVRNATTLIIVEGGEIATQLPRGASVIADDVSEVIMYGGMLGGSIVANSATQIFVSGGMLVGSVICSDQAIIIIDGGAGDSVGACNNGQIFFSDGAFNNIGGGGASSVLHITGGSLVAGPGSGGNSLSSGGLVTISDATLHGEITANGFADFRINSGIILGNITTQSSGVVEIIGGSLSGDLLALDSSMIVLIGPYFNFPFGDITANSGTLTGILADGTALDVNFGRSSTGTITLVPAPEPSALTSLGFGIAMLALLYRRRRYSNVQ